jgi:hypothetical protein
MIFWITHLFSFKIKNGIWLNDSLKDATGWTKEDIVNRTATIIYRASSSEGAFLLPEEGDCTPSYFSLQKAMMC